MQDDFTHQWETILESFGITLLALRGRLVCGLAWRRVCSVMVLLVYIGANMANTVRRKHRRKSSVFGFRKIFG
jgi:hypothetical protein